MVADTELRAQAKKIYAKILNNLDNLEQRQKYRLSARETLLQIQVKTPQDIKKIFEYSSDIALYYFNTNDYLQAGENYIQSINWILKLPLNDKLYRILVRRYIDLADSCYEVGNSLSGDSAIANAVKAFALITTKTPEEQKLNDPTKNFDAFYSHHEDELAEHSYTHTTSFENHQTLMKQSLFSRLADDQLSSLLSGISMDEKTEVRTGLEALFATLAVAPSSGSASISPFIDIKIHEYPSSDDYKKLAQQFIELINRYIEQDLLKKASLTTNEAITILQKIDGSEQQIQSVIVQLQTLEENISKRIDSQERKHVQTELLQMHGFLGQIPQAASRDEDMEVDQFLGFN